VDTDTREEVKKLMEKENDIICIAITKIFSTGINIKNLHNIVLAAGGKSSVTVVQSIGRGLRLHPDKKELNIWDIVDTNYKYSKKHAEKRQEIYATEKIPTKIRNISL
jgi:superfamily II DNA or RNA helicase